MKIKNLLFKIRHFIAIGLILCLCFVGWWWIDNDTVQNSVGQWHRKIINDSYSTLTQPIVDEVGVKQPISVKFDDNFYGVNLFVHTYGRQCSGTMYVDLQDTDGNVLATASADLSTVYNDNVHTFIFGEKNFVSRENTDYILHIYSAPATPEDKIALWKSDGKAWCADEYYWAAGISDFKPMEDNGTLDESTVALQYITSYASGNMSWYFKLIAAMAAFVLAGGYIVVFVLKAKVHNIFLFFALTIGAIFAVLTPLKGAPDEYTHMGMSYYNSNCWLGIEDSYADGRLTVRDCDYGEWLYPVDYNVFDMSVIYDGLREKNTAGDEMTITWARWSEGYFQPLYWAQAAGITLARLLNLGRVQMFVMGRLANLIMYTALVYIALRLMPFFKGTMAAAALTPVALGLAASFNYDPLVIGLCFIFTAKVLNLAYKKEKVTVWDKLLLVLLAVMIAPAKAVYVVILALVLIVPFEKFGGRKQAFITFGVMAFAAVFMWVAYNGNFIGMVKESVFPQSNTEQQIAQDTDGTAALTEETTPETSEAADSADEQTQTADSADEQAQPNADSAAGTDTQAQTGADEDTAQETPAEEPSSSEQSAPAPKDDLLENGDSKYLFSAGYILTHIPDTIKLIIGTVQKNTSLYIYQLFGGIFGEVILSPVHISWLTVAIIMAAVLLTTVKQQDEVLQHTGGRKWWALAVALAVSALLCIACISWTPVNYTEIFGIQGRYFIPVLPLILLFFTNNNFTLKKNIDHILLYIIGAADVMVILESFIFMAENSSFLKW